MRKHNLAFIDLETTGFNPDKHEVIELAGLIARQVPRPGKGPSLEMIEEFEFKIKPEHLDTAEPEALRINGYNEMDWLFAADLTQVMKAVADKTADCTLVTHNLTFDWNFLDHAFRKTGVENKMHYAKLDTISFAYAKLYNREEVQRFSLRSLAEYFGIQNEKAHTALADIRTTFEIYKKLIEL